MNIIIEKEILIKPLKTIISIIKNTNRLINPVLSHFLLRINKNKLYLISSNLEVEIITSILLKKEYSFNEIMIPARKFFNICNSFPKESNINILIIQKKIIISTEKNRFSLCTLPSNNFPKIKDWNKIIEFYISEKKIKKLIENTQFSMANQDVRYYLNGILFEIKENKIKTVSTDGHRLSLSFFNLNQDIPNYSVIIPRLSVFEIMKIVKNTNRILKIEIGEKNIRFLHRSIILTSKLLDGNFPEYNLVFPKKSDKILIINCDTLKNAISRVSILSNEKLNGVRFFIKKNELKINTNNNNYEEAEEFIEIIYSNIELEINFNIRYLLDILNTIECKNVRFTFTDENSGTKIENEDDSSSFYIVMPMRL